MEGYLRTGYIKQLSANITLIELGRSVWENLNLGLTHELGQYYPVQTSRSIISSLAQVWCYALNFSQPSIQSHDLLLE